MDILLVMALSVMVFVVQLVLCWKSSSKAVKLIPVFVMAAAAVVFSMMYIGAFGGAYHELEAFVCTVALCYVAIGDALAWLIHAAVKSIQNRRK